MIGLPWWLYSKESTCQCKRLRFDPWVRRIPWRKKWQPTPVFWPGEFHGLYDPWSHKELDTAEPLSHIHTQGFPFTKVDFDQMLLFYITGKHFFNILKTSTYSVFFSYLRTFAKLYFRFSMYYRNSSFQFSSVAQLCLTLCNPMNHSTPGLPVHHQLPESTQTHVHWVGNAI